MELDGIVEFSPARARRTGREGLKAYTEPSVRTNRPKWRVLARLPVPSAEGVSKAMGESGPSTGSQPVRGLRPAGKSGSFTHLRITSSNCPTRSDWWQTKTSPREASGPCSPPESGL